tara:strand:- start:13 stop:186 length:174 start_codon:yes stop_codon:yes gene_type:complete
MPYENYEEYQRMMADEAKQAAKEESRKNPMRTTNLSDTRREHYDPVSGETYIEVDWP